MQVLLICSLEGTLQEHKAETSEAVQQKRVARISLTDDTTMFGKAAAIADDWERMKASLGEAGHELVPHGCAFLGAEMGPERRCTTTR